MEEKKTEKEIRELLERPIPYDYMLLDWCAKSADDAAFYARAIHVFEWQGIKTIGALVKHSERDLMMFTNFGEKSLNATKHFLANLGLELGMDVEQYIKDKVAEEEREAKQSRQYEQRLWGRYQANIERKKDEVSELDEDVLHQCFSDALFEVSRFQIELMESEEEDKETKDFLSKYCDDE